MKHSYIANETEAALLHSEQQTAIIVPMKSQPERFVNMVNECPKPVSKDHVFCGVTKDGDTIDIVAPYALHQPVYVRECWEPVSSINSTTFEKVGPQIKYAADISEKVKGHDKFRSPATMPKSAARTWFVPVEVQVIRVQDGIGYSNAIAMLEFDYSEGRQFKNYGLDWNRFHDSQYQFGDYRDSWNSYIVAKLGQQAWDENNFVWLYKIEKQ